MLIIKLSTEFPFGQVPVLEVDGEMIPESRAIARFLARRCGLMGQDDVEAAKVDAYVDLVSELSPGRAYMLTQMSSSSSQFYNV